MNIEAVTIEKADLHRLLASGSGDAAMLYLYIRSGNPSANAERELGLTSARLNCAAATLRQLGLMPQEQTPAFQAGERPAYSEQDVLQAMDGDADFRLLYGEVQRLLGRTLNTEDRKSVV